MELAKRLACLHAHHSNIGYAERAFSQFNIELVHFVDPGLLHQLTAEQTFNAAQKAREQIEWMASCRADAILITCTNYIAVLQEAEFSISVPVINIDEPFFEQICQTEMRQLMLFSNPATVAGTMERLNEYARQRKKSPDVECIILEHTFDLIMRGHKEMYDAEIEKRIKQIANNENRLLSVVQLSMVDAAKAAESSISEMIINPLDPLKHYVEGLLKLERRQGVAENEKLS
ncbi:hypothetical protein [Bacillus swezeyi]|uniref:Asp/Glu/hydantoin racemase n=1 Tax=Bacillus swezeyi TaxID=1925020 RepID=A0A5M8S1M1_9BACI|nr:hypothetical protein [Bacillus swezeyi]KAA6452012.1 hypothetical protein DX927_15045 [Bacillus swezeyi]TYS36233.1 hypothetical protein FZC77_14490 [Bacillus swezeyi]